MTEAIKKSTFVPIDVCGKVLTVSHELLRGIKMQRDMEMIRKVLLAIQARKDLDLKELSIEGEDDFPLPTMPNCFMMQVSSAGRLRRLWKRHTRRS